MGRAFFAINSLSTTRSYTPPASDAPTSRAKWAAAVEKPRLALPRFIDGPFWLCKRPFFPKGHGYESDFKCQMNACVQLESVPGVSRFAIGPVQTAIIRQNIPPQFSFNLSLTSHFHTLDRISRYFKAKFSALIR
jgi:hypothetical protein